MFQTYFECGRRGQVLQSHPLPISPLLQTPDPQKGPFAQVSSDLLKTHLLNPHLRHSIRRFFVTCGVFARYFFVVFLWLVRGFFDGSGTATLQRHPISWGVHLNGVIRHIRPGLVQQCWTSMRPMVIWTIFTISTLCFFVSMLAHHVIEVHPGRVPPCGLLIRQSPAAQGQIATPGRPLGFVENADVAIGV